MSTITRELAKLFRKITNSEIDADGNAHVVLSPADSLLINNARIALASLEAEPVGEVSEQRDGLVMDGTVDLGGASTHRIIKGASKMKRLPLGTKFYTPRQRRYLYLMRWKWMMTLTARLNTEKLSDGTPAAPPFFRVLSLYRGGFRAVIGCRLRMIGCLFS